MSIFYKRLWIKRKDQDFDQLLKQFLFTMLVDVFDIIKYSNYSANSRQLSAVSRLSLGVYDVLGRQVAILVDGVKEAGSYTATFDGAGLASGVYIRRLFATPEDGSKPFTQVKRIILMK